ncbi:hypothetical protein TVAG_118030 [Trichomonas vaginalis G3]|uniref:Uncharacterized protein n=1 Tax=Trichomonas vaginalis (strain ATCC PRA-98 / G3) TaxID=412133 RepID=A2EHZ0_TRIV3|nr:hypothetical protein TVAGG3_0230140 [Trichomonas vaginalis G3]EAY07722.1 hypothetical protein TVAG_118030 [Trichomonas vaginalis G3]KAI5552566.1 hypothetical protein TVAGG3_0230140 [Trichomonas vaginalis G3]|eukprot:XP_001319945.1 hypothetical protein [Trichomonas vaginalis G3]
MSKNYKPIIQDLVSSLNDLKVRREIAIDSGNDFLSQFLPQRLDIPQDQLERINQKYKIDESELYEEPSEDNYPVRQRTLSFSNQYIFSKISKPSQDEAEKKKSKEPEEEKPKIPQKPPVTLCDRDTQSYRNQLTTTYNFPIQIFEAQNTKPVITYNTQATNTKETRKRNEATNTEALLPQYEARCMELIQSIINDAPLTASSVPSEEALGDLLLQFVNQILRDAPDIDNSQRQKPSTPSSTPKADIPSQSITKERQLATVTVQCDSLETVDNGTQTQGRISLRTLVSKPGPTIDPVQPPSKPETPLYITPGPSVSNPVPEKAPIRIGNPDSVERPEFEYPPSLRIEDSNSDMQKPLSPAPKPQKQNLQLETIVRETYDVKPNPQKSDLRQRQTNTSMQNLITQLTPEPPLVVNEFDQIQQPKQPQNQQPKPQPAKPQKKGIELPPLGPIFALPSDVEEFSALDLTSMLQSDSDDGELPSVSSTYSPSNVSSPSNASSSLGNDASSIDTSAINRLIEGISDDDDSEIDSKLQSALNDISVGEVTSSILTDTGNIAFMETD